MDPSTGHWGNLFGGGGPLTEVVVERMSHIPLHQRARMWIPVAIVRPLLLAWEEADVVALRGNHDQELGLRSGDSISHEGHGHGPTGPIKHRTKTDLPSRVHLEQQFAHIPDLFLEDVLILTFGHAIPEVIDVIGKLSPTDGGRPMLDQRQETTLNVRRGDHLDSTTVRLTSGRVSYTDA